MMQFRMPLVALVLITISIHLLGDNPAFLLLVREGKAEIVPFTHAIAFMAQLTQEHRPLTMRAINTWGIVTPLAFHAGPHNTTIITLDGTQKTAHPLILDQRKFGWPAFFVMLAHDKCRRHLEGPLNKSEPSSAKNTVPCIGDAAKSAYALAQARAYSAQRDLIILARASNTTGIFGLSETGAPTWGLVMQTATTSQKDAATSATQQPQQGKGVADKPKTAQKTTQKTTQKTEAKRNAPSKKAKAKNASPSKNTSDKPSPESSATAKEKEKPATKETAARESSVKNADTQKAAASPLASVPNYQVMSYQLPTTPAYQPPTISSPVIPSSPAVRSPSGTSAPAVPAPRTSMAPSLKTAIDVEPESVAVDDARGTRAASRSRTSLIQAAQSGNTEHGGTAEDDASAHNRSQKIVTNEGDAAHSRGTQKNHASTPEPAVRSPFSRVPFFVQMIGACALIMAFIRLRRRWL